MGAVDVGAQELDGGVVSRAALGVLMASFPGTSVPDWLVRAVRHGLGGVALFAENTPQPEVAQEVCTRLHALDPELVVTVDEEGGDVTRLEAVTGSSLPGNAALGVVDDLRLTTGVGSALGEVLHAVGVDLDLGPCLDVVSEPWNPVVGTRSFGADPALVARHGAATVAAMARAGAGTCGKHFPGHGATLVDSHLGLPVLDVDPGQLRRRDLPPFTAAVAAGMDAVMTAHVVVPRLGPGPASLEPWSTRLLRRGGFGGPVVTDALGMRAVGDDLGAAAVAALAAGADLLCLDAPQERDAETALHQAWRAVVAAVRAGLLPLTSLQRSAMRTRALGQRAAGRRARPGPTLVDSLSRLQEVGSEAADRALRVEGEVALTGAVLRHGAPRLVDLRRGHNLASGPTSTAFGTALERRLAEIGGPARTPAPAVPLPAGTTGASAAPGDPTLGDPAVGDPAVGDPAVGDPAVGDRSEPVLVLVREPHPDRAEGRALAEILRHRPDAVVVHCGVPATAPEAPHRVLCHGVGRANAEAVMRRVLPPA